MLPAASNFTGSTLRLYLSKTPASTATLDGTASTFCCSPILIGARAVLEAGADWGAAGGATESGLGASAAFEGGAGDAAGSERQARANSPALAPASPRQESP